MKFGGSSQGDLYVAIRFDVAGSTSCPLLIYPRKGFVDEGFGA
ncbi:MAG: hypothetical protein XXXJIFNMEKO3_00281 [Candidatus Erwinia impunctatus]|nr:hypothetical protein XXXJIFNMEKO_00281 [Culicoides impunctatus]